MTSWREPRSRSGAFLSSPIQTCYSCWPLPSGEAIESGPVSRAGAGIAAMGRIGAGDFGAPKGSGAARHVPAQPKGVETALPGRRLEPIPRAATRPTARCGWAGRAVRPKRRRPGDGEGADDAGRAGGAAGCDHPGRPVGGGERALTTSANNKGRRPKEGLREMTWLGTSLLVLGALIIASLALWVGVQTVRRHLSARESSGPRLDHRLNPNE